MIRTGLLNIDKKRPWNNYIIVEKPGATGPPDILIESLFIDEGFGTLDPEVLETTIGTLEQLQAESNKTVGIISHVDSMRERIYTQVQLEKQQNGFSTMKIYPETS